MGDVLFLVGGIIPAGDDERLVEAGVARVFGPGTHTSDVVTYIDGRLGRDTAP